MSIGEVKLWEYRFVAPTWNGEGKYSPQDWEEIAHPIAVEEIARRMNELADKLGGRHEECRRTAERTMLVKVRIQ